MKFELVNSFEDGYGVYKCELTDYLDKLSGFAANDYKSHYILRRKNNRYFSICVLGGTVGVAHFDNEKITGILIETEYVVKTYPDNVNDLVKNKYVGEIIKWEI